MEWIFIDEISMINSKVWAVLNDIKTKYNFKFVLMGDFGQFCFIIAIIVIIVYIHIFCFIIVILIILIIKIIDIIVLVV